MPPLLQEQIALNIVIKLNFSIFKFFTIKIGNDQFIVFLLNNKWFSVLTISIFSLFRLTIDSI